MPRARRPDSRGRRRAARETRPCANREALRRPRASRTPPRGRTLTVKPQTTSPPGFDDQDGDAIHIGGGARSALEVLGHPAGLTAPDCVLLHRLHLLEPREPLVTSRRAAPSPRLTSPGRPPRRTAPPPPPPCPREHASCGEEPVPQGRFAALDLMLPTPLLSAAKPSLTEIPYPTGEPNPSTRRPPASSRSGRRRTGACRAGPTNELVRLAPRCKRLRQAGWSRALEPPRRTLKPILAPSSDMAGPRPSANNDGRTYGMASSRRWAGDSPPTRPGTAWPTETRQGTVPRHGAGLDVADRRFPGERRLRPCPERRSFQQSRCGLSRSLLVQLGEPESGEPAGGSRSSAGSAIP